MQILWWMIVGAVAGWATGRLMRGDGYGPLVDLIVGVAGGVIAGWEWPIFMTALGSIPSGGVLGTIVAAIFGGMALTAIVRLIARRRVSGKGRMRDAA